MQKSTPILLFFIAAFFIMAILAALFVLTKGASSSNHKIKISDEKPTVSLNKRQKNETSWVKELATINKQTKSYSYPVQEIYINLNSK